MNHSRLEQYLDELERPLASLGETARREWREEAQQHLGDLVAAHQEMGAREDEAIDAALQQFGDACLVGRGVRRESHVPFWRDQTWHHRLTLLVGGHVGLVTLIWIAGSVAGPEPPVVLQSRFALLVVGCAMLLGVPAGLAAVSRKWRVARVFAGACAAAIAGPSIALVVEPLARHIFGQPQALFDDPLVLIGNALPAGALIWARRTRPSRAALGTSLWYLVSLTAYVGLRMTQKVGSLNNVNAETFRFLCTSLALWALQGALIGGFLGVTRRALGQAIVKVRRRFEQVGSFAEFTTR